MIVVGKLFVLVLVLFIQIGLSDLGNRDDVIFKKRASNDKKEEAVQPNNTQTRQRKRKRYETDEQKRRRNVSVRIYRAKQTKKGLKEAKETLSPKAYEKLKAAAEKRAHQQQGYEKTMREKQKARFAAGTETKQDIRSLERRKRLKDTKQYIKKSNQRKMDIENANKAALGEYSGPSWLTKKPDHAPSQAPKNSKSSS